MNFQLRLFTSLVQAIYKCSRNNYLKLLLQKWSYFDISGQFWPKKDYVACGYMSICGILFINHRAKDRSPQKRGTIRCLTFNKVNTTMITVSVDFQANLSWYQLKSTEKCVEQNSSNALSYLGSKKNKCFMAWVIFSC